MTMSNDNLQHVKSFDPATDSANENFTDERLPEDTANSSSKGADKVASLENQQSGGDSDIEIIPLVLSPDESQVSLNNEPNAGNGSAQEPYTGFSIETLKFYLESCSQDASGEIDLDSYRNAYREICKLLDSLGSVVRTLIGKDIKSKVASLQRLKEGPNGTFYETIDKMVSFEIATKLYETSPSESGFRTVLTLHRSLQFVAEFLRSLNKLKAKHNVGGIAKEVYERTLAPFHPWGWRTVAVLAFSILGKKGQLVSNFHGGNLSSVRLHQVMEGVVNAATLVYTRCQKIFEKYDLQNLS